MSSKCLEPVTTGEDPNNNDPLSSRLQDLEEELQKVLDNAMEAKANGGSSGVRLGPGGHGVDPFPVFSDLLQQQEKRRKATRIKRMISVLYKKK
ncbi:uncharacterized protein VTP21DRAFT_6617 [Calcarisporiella thermophila]|uniref:uncharacterized protein n=1 Tax=Calcarisporiella thermophila TaxID=911321 RepID=UPI003742D400